MIGIVSGAGPLAGLDVARKIIEETDARTDQEHLPVVLLSIPEEIPDRPSFLLGQHHHNPGIPIGQFFLRLEQAGASVAAIACNTAHAEPIFAEVRRSLAMTDSRLRVLHMIDATLGSIVEQFSSGTRVGLLSTDVTRRLGLYRIPLEARGFTVVEADEDIQATIQLAIFDQQEGIKAQSSPVSGKAIAWVERAMDFLVDRGAEILLMGCTELPLAITGTTYKRVPIVDPNRILARSLIAALSPEKLKY